MKKLDSSVARDREEGETENSFLSPSRNKTAMKSRVAKNSKPIGVHLPESEDVESTWLESQIAGSLGARVGRHKDFNVIKKGGVPYIRFKDD